MEMHVYEVVTRKGDDFEERMITETHIEEVDVKSIDEMDELYDYDGFFWKQYVGEGKDKKLVNTYVKRYPGNANRFTQYSEEDLKYPPSWWL